MKGQAFKSFSPNFLFKNTNEENQIRKELAGIFELIEILV
jgi:hypothetical protein